MNHPELLDFLSQISSREIIRENKTSVNLHCIGCGKYKDKRSKSPKCTVCLFNMTTKEAIKRGFYSRMTQICTCGHKKTLTPPHIITKEIRK